MGDVADPMHVDARTWSSPISSTVPFNLPIMVQGLRQGWVSGAMISSAGKVGAVACGVAGQQAMSPGFKCMRPDQEVRQGPLTATAPLPVFAVRPTGGQRGLERYVLEGPQRRDKDALIALRRNELMRNFGCDNGIEYQVAIPPCFSNLLPGPARPLRAGLDDINDDVGINDCRGHHNPWSWS
jgi:hypothetical protein